MGKKDPRVDAYIEKSEPFAKPILLHLRELIHKYVPEVEETIKWQFPCFDYKGPFCHFASFKKHVAFGFWKASLIEDTNGILKIDKSEGGNAMGNFGKVASVNELPPEKAIAEILLKAKNLNDEGIKVASKPKNDPASLEVPDYFMDALKENPKALSTFENFSFSNRKEYLTWITGAKTEKTRNERLKTAVEWMSEGKIRNWKYVKK